MVTFPLIAGILASSVHVLTGPDHLAAVSPLVVETNKKVWRVGLLWGLGHISGMMAIGLLVYFFKSIIPFEAISAFSEQIVGIILILMGIWILVKTFTKGKNHVHPHIHADNKEAFIHIHEHQHEQVASHEHKHLSKPARHLPYGIGFIHGLAGVSHLILLLPVLSFDTSLGSIWYIFGFGIGSVLAMILYTVLLGIVSSSISSEGRPKLNIALRVITATFALLVGAYWLIG